MPDEDDFFKPQADLNGPRPSLLMAGPDSMRGGARGAQGTGSPFIYLPTHKLVMGDGVNGHEQMIDPKFPRFEEMLHACFPTPQEYEEVGRETAYRGQPFYETIELRGKMQKKALFGRVGRIQGHNVVSVWPGTERMQELLPAACKDLLAAGQVHAEATVVIMRNPICTVAEMIRRGDAALDGLKQADAAGTALLRPPAPQKGGQYASPSEIRAARQRDVDNAIKGGPFSYAYRYGEGKKLDGFKDFLEGQSDGS